MRVGDLRGEQRCDGDAEHCADQQHLQVPGVPIAPVDPDRDGVLHDQDRQHDGGRLQGRQRQREQRGRDHADAREATLAEPKQCHCRDGEQIEQRIGDDGHAAGGILRPG